MARKRLSNEAAQITVFKQTAREHGCDESEGSFDTALGKIGRAKVEPAPKKKPRKPLKIVLPDA